MEHSANQKNLEGLLGTEDPYQEEGWKAQEVALNQTQEGEKETKTYSILERNNWESKMLYKPYVYNSKSLLPLYIDR